MTRAASHALGCSTLFIATLMLAPIPEALATEVGTSRTVGIGVALGDPTGIVGKLFLNPGNAIDLGIGWGRWGWGHNCRNSKDRNYSCGNWGRQVSMHADYLWQSNLVRGTAKLDWHIGAGARVWFYRWSGDPDDTDLSLAARMPLGLDLAFDRPEFLEVFFEIVPSFLLLPGPDIYFDAAIGVRFFF